MRLIFSLILLILAAPYASASDEANCSACTASYHCESYEHSCMSACAAKATADPASRGPCEEACKKELTSCLDHAKKDCADYCK
jgi:hypothetical protein